VNDDTLDAYTTAEIAEAADRGVWIGSVVLARRLGAPLAEPHRRRAPDDHAQIDYGAIPRDVAIAHYRTRLGLTAAAFHEARENARRAHA
jgi:hypothetical protein